MYVNFFSVKLGKKGCAKVIKYPVRISTMSYYTYQDTPERPGLLSTVQGGCQGPSSL